MRPKTLYIQLIPHEGRDNHLEGAADGCHRFLTGLESVEDYSLHFDCELPVLKKLPVLSPEAGIADVQIKKFAERQYKLADRTLFVGGDHGIAYGTISAALECWPKLVVLQFDAHLDRRERHQGERISHATVFNRLEQEYPDRLFFAFGIRARASVETVPVPDQIFYGADIQRPLRVLLESLPADTPLYLSLDIDVLDPSVFPAVSNPEPGGPNWLELIGALKLLEGRLVAADLNEYVPAAVHGAPAWDCVAGALLKELAIALSE